jgi:hypothetical protein
VTVYPVSIVPAVIDAIVAQVGAYLPTGAKVYDGFGLSEDLGVSVLMVGVDDADAENEGVASEARQEWAMTGNLRRDETGYVTCAAVGWDGDAVMKAARDTAYSIVSAVEQLCRNNPTLGLDNRGPTLGSMINTSFGGRVVLTQNQAQQGSIAVVIFRVNFLARL